MNKLIMLTLSAAVLVSSSAFAQGLTRTEVRQQLVEAEQNGSLYVTDTSYPAVNPIYQDQVAKLVQKNATAYGGVHAETVMSGARISSSGTAGQQACVGPASFCNVYAGS
jgi:Domain of unknown function (DUF4148)